MFCNLYSYIMPNGETEKEKVGDLVNDARASLADLLQFNELRSDRWYMRLSAEGQARRWEELTNDSKENDQAIRDKITRSEKPVTDLVLAFVGLMQWRGKKQRMAYMQYFRTKRATGLVFGSHLKKAFLRRRVHAYGGFLIMGGCKNIWI